MQQASGWGTAVINLSAHPPHGDHGRGVLDVGKIKWEDVALRLTLRSERAGPRRLPPPAERDGGQ